MPDDAKPDDKAPDAKPADAKPADSKPADAKAAEQPSPAVALKATTTLPVAEAQVAAPGVPVTTTPGRVMRRYAHVTGQHAIREIEEADAPPKAKDGERVVDVTMVPAFPGNIVDAVGNVSPATISGQASAQAIVPEVTPATVPGISISAVPMTPNSITGS